MRKFLNKPVTWGGYIKLSIWATVIGMIITAGWWVCIFGSWKDWKIFSKESDEETE